MVNTLAKCVSLLKERLKPKGYSLMYNVGQSANPTASIHIIPRYDADHFKWTYKDKTSADAFEFEELKTMLIPALSSVLNP